MENNTSIAFLQYVKTQFQKIKTQAEESINQVKHEEDLTEQFNKASNSIAILVKHLSGNMRSRWTDIFTTDGEKSTRNRPSEFDRKYQPSKHELMNRWQEGWEVLFDTLNSLEPQDLDRRIFIRKEPHSVLQALMRQLVHYSVHVGQITFIAKLIEGENWKNQSIPRDKEIFDYTEMNNHL